MLNNCLKTAKEFSRKHRFNYQVLEFKKSELWGNDNKEEHQKWASFEKKPGLYILATSGEVVYIGISSSGLNVGQRLFRHFTNDEKLEKLNEESDVVILSFDEKDKAMTLSLESHLIEKFQPVLNKKNP